MTGKLYFDHYCEPPETITLPNGGDVKIRWVCECGLHWTTYSWTYKDMKELVITPRWSVVRT